jgi:hypothetical protein
MYGNFGDLAKSRKTEEVTDCYTGADPDHEQSSQPDYFFIFDQVKAFFYQGLEKGRFSHQFNDPIPNGDFYLIKTILNIHFMFSRKMIYFDVVILMIFPFSDATTRTTLDRTVPLDDLALPVKMSR